MKNESRNFCMNIKKIRAEYQLSKAEMSKILGISVSSLNKLEDGVIPRISCEIVYRMMDYFHLTAEEVFGGESGVE